jgi:hypothetical protein
MRKLLLLACLIPLSFCCGCRGCNESTKQKPSQGQVAEHTPPSQKPGEKQTPRPHPPRHKLTEAEIRYGLPPSTDPRVVYRDDVVIVGGGAESVRSESATGFIWIIDAHAPRAQELRPGSIMFLTSRAAGRVLALQQKGDDLALLLGPADITEAIKKADISFDEPLDQSQVVAYIAPNYPAVQYGPEKNDDSSQITDPIQATPASYASSPYMIPSLIPYLVASPFAPQLPGSGQDLFSAAEKAMPPPIQGPQVVHVTQGDLTTKGVCCEDRGIQAIYNNHDVVVEASAKLHFDQPRIRGEIKMNFSGVYHVHLELTGAARFEVSFEAGSASGLNSVEGNVEARVWLPVDFTILNVAVPVNAGTSFGITPTFQFGMYIHTGFSAKNGTLKASAKYQYGGSFFVDYSNGKWAHGGPTVTKVDQSLPNSIEGASIGASGGSMGFLMRFIVGFGAFRVMVGPYVDFVPGIGFSKNSSITGVISPGAMGRAGPPVCRTATLDLEMHAGIGYSIPQSVATFINFFLGLLHLKPISRIGDVSLKRFLLLDPPLRFDNCHTGPLPPPPP